MASRRWLAFAGVAIGLVAVLGYLRDPPWLIHVTSGLRGREQSPDGVRFRWMSGRASFFVPAGAVAMEIPLRAEFDRPGDWPIVAEISIDDVPAARVTFTDDRWRTIRVDLPPPGSRRVRRIDIRVNRTRPGERGLQVGEVGSRVGAELAPPGPTRVGPYDRRLRDPSVTLSEVRWR